MRKHVLPLLAGALLLVPSATFAQDAGPPGAPQAVAVAAGDERIDLAWMPPASDGGSAITEYGIGLLNAGTIIWHFGVPSDTTSLTLVGPDQFAFNDLAVQVEVSAWNVHGAGPAALSEEVTPREGAAPPTVALGSISPSGGSVTSDTAGTGPTLSAPVTTTVTAPATADGGIVTIAETSIGEVPAGFVLLGQQIIIESTVATNADNPLQIVFKLDPALVPITILRNGVAVEEPCVSAGVASPSPCIAAGAGTAQITVLTAAASTWSLGIRPYAFQGFASPADNRGPMNVVRPGSAVPVRFGLGGDQGSNVIVSGYPKSVQVDCSSRAPMGPLEEAAVSSALVYQEGSRTYQFIWKTDPSWGQTCRDLIVRFRDATEESMVTRFR